MRLPALGSPLARPRARFDRRLGLILVLVSACSEPARAPGAAPLDSDAGSALSDAEPAPPLDCRSALATEDADRDGFSPVRGDCDDCDFARGPAALDLPDNGVDEDCDGKDAADAATTCDPELDAQDFTPEAAAQAIGLCDAPSRASHLPGLISASWKRLSGSGELGDTRQVWLPTLFGTIEPREGKRLLVLSTGSSRDLADPGYTRDCDILGSSRMADGRWSDARVPPDGYPMDSSRCSSGVEPGAALAYNDIVLELTLRAPSNASSFSFDSLFFTYEYPDFVCSAYNDFFIVQVDSRPDGLRDDNVLFDASGDTIGVNTGLLTVCREAERGRVERPTSCELGPGLLAKTGFDQGESICAAKQTDLRDIGGAATGWLHTVVPVEAGELLSVRFVLWDSGDPLLDSTALVDNFSWSLASPREPGTSPIAD